MNAMTAIAPAPPDAVNVWFRDVISAERDALSRFLRASAVDVSATVALIARQERPVVLLGVGKSGHVGAKLAATFASLGTPALFLNAAEAAHGDLGAVAAGSVVVILSNSGTTGEIIRIVPGLKARHCPLIGIIGRAASPLARAVDHLILAEVEREADHIGMAPTCSTTLQIAIGDALAVAVSRLRGFTRADFLRHHPAGLLGRRMLPVRQLMRTGERLPTVLPDVALADTVSVISSGRLGGACVVDQSGGLLGYVSDGDVRRLIERRGDLYATATGAIMRRDCQAIDLDATVGDALALATRRSLSVLPVVQNVKRLVGIVHLHDLIGADG